MNETHIVFESQVVLAKVEVDAHDQRTGAEESLTVFCELTEMEQDPKPIVERALKRMGYMYSGIVALDTTSVPFDAEALYLKGKELEQGDLR